MVVMLAMMFAFLLIYEVSLEINDAAIDNFEIENKIMHTGISITSLTISDGIDDPRFTINNISSEKLWDFDNFEIIIEYEGENTPTSRLVETMTYAGACSGDPSVGNWCIDAWNNDNMDPNILNSGESIDVIARISDNMDNNGSGLFFVTVSTDNGVLASDSGTI